MICPPADTKAIIFIQQCHRNHKVYVKSLNICNNNIYELLADMDFSILIDFDGTKISGSSGNFLPFHIDKFLPLHLCSISNEFSDSGTSGYRSIGKLLSK